MHPIVQEVEIAEAALEQYISALRSVNGGGLTLHLDQTAAIGAAEQTYPEIWSRLDSARRHAAASGRDLSYYDAIRQHVGVDAGRGIVSRSTEVRGLVIGVVPVLGSASTTAEGNADGVRAARDAIATFRHQFADLPWHERSDAPVAELRTGQGFAKVIAVVGAVILAGGFLAFYLGAI